MPDESDDRDAPDDVDAPDPADAPDDHASDGAGDSSTPDAADDAPDSSTDDATDDADADEAAAAADETPDPGEFGDAGRDVGDDAAADSADGADVDADTDADADADTDAASDEGADDAASADDDSGGLKKVESDAEPRTRRVDEPEGESVVADEDKVPNRGVEAGFDEPEDAPEGPAEAGAGRGPGPHPDRANDGGSSDVPVGHAAGAPTPGEATPAGAGGGGGGTATGAAGGYEPTDDEMFEGPPDDEEMPLADHIEEMVLRLAAVVTVGAVATALMYLYADRLVVLMWNDVIPGGSLASRPRLYGPLEFILTKIKVASLAGILIALPVFVYQSYLFMRPGLYPKERKYYLASVPTSLVLASVGMAFAYFAVLPGLFQYFDYYTKASAIVAYGLAPTFNLIVALMGLLAVVFQIPLFVMLAIMMGVTTRRWLEQRRLLFWGAFAGIAFLFAPDPTGMAPFIIAVTMIVLFEGTLLLLRWTGR